MTNSTREKIKELIREILPLLDGEGVIAADMVETLRVIALDLKYLPQDSSDFDD